jgi:hypothetical protein
MTPLETAILYLHREWRVVPIPSGEKGPKLPGWQNLALRADELFRYFGTSQNVGVILGAKSGELVDVDPDCAEALALADLYLPATRAMFGRPSKPRSHRILLAPNAVYESFVDPLTGETLLELRAGGGHQTLFPPSITDGERREWYGDVIAPRLIDAEFLRAAVSWLAVGCLFSRYVSGYAAERPDEDFVHLLDEIDLLDGHEGKLGQAGRRWLGMPDLGAPKPKSTQWRERDRKSGRSDRTELDLAELAAAIPNDEDWIGWNRLGLAFYAASDGDDGGFTAFDRWSRKSPKYDPRTVAERWRNYHRSPPTRIGVGSLVHFACQQGWTSRMRPRARR